MPASMIVSLMLIGDDKLDRIPSTEFDPCEILIALEDRDDAEWETLGYSSRSQFINAHINGEI